MIKLLIKTVKQSFIWLCTKVMASKLCYIIEMPFSCCLHVCSGDEEEELLDEQTTLIRMDYNDSYPGQGCSRYCRRWVGRCCVGDPEEEEEMVDFYGGLAAQDLADRSRPSLPIVHQPRSTRHLSLL